MHISNRLKWLASYVEVGDTFADIGTDHGYVPIFLLKEKKIKKAIAMDVNNGPLFKAKANAFLYEINESIEFRLSNGLEKLNPGEAQSILIAGMGGILIRDILHEGIETAKLAEEIILSPHSDWEAVRRFLFENNFEIVEEDMIIDEGKYYIMIKVSYTTEQIQKMDDIILKYGKKLIESKNKVFIKYLKKEKNKLLEIIEKMDKNSTDVISKLMKKLQELESVLMMTMEE